MKKCIIIPDSFKGTMSSAEVCNIIQNSIKSRFPQCETISVPIADGGEGTVDCFLTAVPGEKVFLTVKNAFNEDIKGFYGKIGETSIIEMATVAGMITNNLLDPLTASTYGVGQLIKHAVEGGCKKIILGLGGSCTNDAGAGMAAALGTKFYDDKGNCFIPTGGTLSKAHSIDNSAAELFLSNVEICCMCDIDNPMYGSKGAAYVFAPQKGADESQVVLLDENLRAFADLIEKELKVDAAHIRGGGAAGAMGAGAYAFLKAKLEQGIDVILNLVDFGSLLDSCDYVFTGEGKLDVQSLSGKVVVGVGRYACMYNVPVIAVVGTLDDDLGQIYDMGITSIYTTADKNQTFEQIKSNCKDDLARTMNTILDDIEGVRI